MVSQPEEAAHVESHSCSNDYIDPLGWLRGEVGVADNSSRHRDHFANSVTVVYYSASIGGI